jgi:hypothetical protein
MTELNKFQITTLNPKGINEKGAIKIANTGPYKYRSKYSLGYSRYSGI